MYAAIPSLYSALLPSVYTVQLAFCVQHSTVHCTASLLCTLYTVQHSLLCTLYTVQHSTVLCNLTLYMYTTGRAE